MSLTVFTLTLSVAPEAELLRRLLILIRVIRPTFGDSKKATVDEERRDNIAILFMVNNR